MVQRWGKKDNLEELEENKSGGSMQSESENNIRCC